MQHKKFTMDSTSRAALAATTEKRNTELFNQLCEAARKLDALGIYKILNENNQKLDSVKIGTPAYDAKSVVMQMAEENNIKAVEILIQECKANAADAVEGFARANQAKTVERYLEDVAAGDRAARGFAFVNATKELNSMLNHGAPLSDAAYGAARAGNDKLVYDLVERKQADLAVAKLALVGFIHSGMQDHAEHLILRATQFLKLRNATARGLMQLLGEKSSAKDDVDALGNLCNTAIGAYAETEVLFNQTKLLKLLSTTKDEGIVKHFEAFLNRDKKTINGLMDTMTVPDIIQKAAAIRVALHKTTTLTYDEALASGVGDIKPEPKPNLLSKFRLHPKPAAAAAAPEVKADAVVAEAPKPDTAPPSPKK